MFKYSANIFVKTVVPATIFYPENQQYESDGSGCSIKTVGTGRLRIADIKVRPVKHFHFRQVAISCVWNFLVSCNAACVDSPREQGAASAGAARVLAPEDPRADCLPGPLTKGGQ